MSQETNAAEPAPADGPPELKVAAHVLIQLGSELVTDAEQAILECVKNAYDADSKDCFIEIDTRETKTLTETAPALRLRPFTQDSENVSVRLDEEPERFNEKGILISNATRHLTYTGRITIEDAGDGISPADLRTSWLVISRSVKRASDGKKKQTKSKRTPLGDKGLGRLGTMKLGDILLVESARSEDEDIGTAQFRWADCRTAGTVDQIPVTTGSRPNTERFKGTKVSVLGLNDLREWRRPNRLLEITGSLTRLISPFEATSTFHVDIKLDAGDQSLGTMTEELLNKAVARFDFEWRTEGEEGKRELYSVARFKKRLFTPARAGKMRDKAEASFLPDDGASFVEFLKTHRFMGQYDTLKIDREGPWFLELVGRKPWASLMLKDQASVKDPGPFKGAFYYFFLDAQGDADLEQETISPTDRPLIKAMSGISILRDGFRVRSQGDWLDLAASMTSGSIYQMRVNNTVGYFALTGEHNYGLTEKSDREGFVEDASYRCFYQIAFASKKFANDALDNVRRIFDEHHKESSDKPGAPRPLNTEKSLQIMDVGAKVLRDVRNNARNIAGTLLGEIEMIEQDAAVPGSGEKVAARALSVARSAAVAYEEMRQKLEPVPQADQALRRLRQDLDDSREQAQLLFESAAIGLSARGLAHELRTHLGEIRTRAAALEKSGRSGASDFMPNVRAIRGACTEIQKAAALIEPMMPRTRTLKDTFELAAFVNEYVATRTTLYARYDIAILVNVAPRTPKIRMSRAKLTQVIDNLVRNSAFWLRNGVVDGPDRDLAIGIDVTPFGFVVSDTGPGVDTSYETSLFDLFVTAKPDPDKGQGLGLFIVSNLLKAEGCEIELLPERNPQGRRYKFAVNLSAVVVEDKSLS